MVNLSGVDSSEMIDELEGRDIHVGAPQWEVLKDCDDYDLRDELESRGYIVSSSFELTNESDIFELYELKRINSEHFDKAFANFIWEKCGRIL